MMIAVGNFVPHSTDVYKRQIVYAAEKKEIAVSGQSTDTAISFFSAAYTILLMACASVWNKQMCIRDRYNPDGLIIFLSLLVESDG